MPRRYLVGAAIGVLLLALNGLSTVLPGQDRSRVWSASGWVERAGAMLLAAGL
jgi:hypothetical protein